MSEMYSAKRVVDKTAPWGRPEAVVLGDEVASFRRTVKERPSKHSLKMKRRYVGS